MRDSPALQYSAAVAELDEIVYGLIAERRAKGASASASESETSPSGDLMDRLMAARDDDGSTMGDRALRDELMTLLVAGQETSAIVLAWACHFLSLYPDLQEDVASEVASVVGDRPVLASDVPNLRLVQARVVTR